MRFIFLISFLLLSACLKQGGGVDTTAPINKKILLRWQVGEELMNDCEQNQIRCPEYLAFLEQWDKDNPLISFEASLAAHKKRVASGQAM